MGPVHFIVTMEQILWVQLPARFEFKTKITTFTQEQNPRYCGKRVEIKNDKLKLQENCNINM